MRLLKSIGSTTISLAFFLGSMLFAGITPVSADEATVAEGKELAFNRKKGNCLACHMIAGGTLPGNIGPPLTAMKERFPDKSDLRAQIWDARTNNTGTIMPPFGTNKIMSSDEIDKVTDFIHSL